MISLTPEIFNWIENHIGDDVSKLRLRYHKQMTEELDFAIMQIECRRKASKKLSETLQKREFLFPTTLSAEQCTSDLLSTYHTTLIGKGVSLVDLTCGLGIDVYHFAKKASDVTAVERESEIAQSVEYNASVLGLENISVINDDCCEFIKTTTNHFDVAFIDPARRGCGGKRLFALSDCEPNVIDIIDYIRAKSDKLIIKASPMLDITQVLRELPEITEIYLIGTPQECKEVVAIINFKLETMPKSVNIQAVTLGKNTISQFGYKIEDEIIASSKYEEPAVGDYLYEPFPSVMKAAPFKLLSDRYNVSKLHINTHLYVSRMLLNDFPGDVFKIEQIIPFSSKEIKKFSIDFPQINVAVRNFILSADDLRRKLKVKDGGDKRVFGCTIVDGSRQLIVVSKV